MYMDAGGDQGQDSQMLVTKFTTGNLVLLYTCTQKVTSSHYTARVIFCSLKDVTAAMTIEKELFKHKQKVRVIPRFVECK